jgi:hypothetical protein
MDVYLKGRRQDMPDEYGPAIAALQQKLIEQQQGVNETKRTINLLLKMGDQSPMYQEDEPESGGPVRADQFYGKGLATSAAEYLATRKQACQPDEILRALTAGGFDFDLQGWKENDRLRFLAISLAKNTGGTGKFHRLKNGSFGLRGWYDEDFLKKAAAGADAATKAKKERKSKGKPKRGRPPSKGSAKTKSQPDAELDSGKEKKE